MTDTKDLLRMLQGLKAARAEVPPEGFKTRAELEKEWGISSAKAKLLIRQGLDAGILRQVDVRIMTPAGLRAMPHYGPA